jgi:hypothetical protein
MADGEYGDSKKEQSGGKQEHKGERWTRCTLENNIGKNLRAKLCINKADVTNDAQKYPKVLYYALN